MRNINYHSALTVKDFGWGKSKLSTLKRLLLFDTELKSKFYVLDSVHSVEQNIFNNKFYEIGNTHEEFIVCLKNKDSKVESVLYMIRCALAHRSFHIKKCKNERYYFMENINRGKIKGRLILNEKTLLKWIDIIKI